MLGFTAFVSVVTVTAISDPEPNFHTYLMVGQSNMEGATHGGQKIEYFFENVGHKNACTPNFGSTPNNFTGVYEWLIDPVRKAQARRVFHS